jgi:hypothetical protein
LKSKSRIVMTRFATICILSCAAAVSAPSAARAQSGASAAAHSAAPAPAGAAIDLRPRFMPGEVLRYQMELVTTTMGSTGGVVQDPQGPTRLVVTWDATVRIDVLPPDVAVSPDVVASPSVAAHPASSAAASSPPSLASPTALRLRMTYEKSAATIETDGYDPNARTIQDQYQRLQGHAVEITLDAHGKVTDVSGGDDVFATPQAARDAQAWISQLSSGVGAPGATIKLGQEWSADQPATGIPLPDMFWHTDSTYQRDEPCRQSAPDAPPVAVAPSVAAPPPAAAPPAAPATDETCAVILTRVSLMPSKATLKAENNAIKNNAAPSGSDATSRRAIPKGLQTSGTWTGSSESLIRVSLRTGWVVSVSQSGDEKMDVTLLSEHLDSIRYAGAVHSHVTFLLLPQ